MGRFLVAMSIFYAGICTAVAPASGGPPITDPETLPGAAVYRSRCQGCHEGQAPKAPSRTFLQLLTPEAIKQALSMGIMQAQAAGLSDTDKGAVAEYLSGTALGAPPPLTAPRCTGTAARFDETREPDTVGWGFTATNEHFISGTAASLSRADVPRLKVKWVFAYPATVRTRSRPTFAYGGLFVGSQDGTVYALNAQTGCIRWSFKSSAEVRTAVVVATAPDQSKRAYFGDIIGRVYALDAITGRELWRRKVDDHPSATITGTPVVHAGTLYIPVSSLEEGTINPQYPCCTFRGSVVALDAVSGAQRWKRYMIDQAPQARGTTKSGVPIFTPAGAAVWNSPTVDEKRGLLYVGTGNNYTGPADRRSNSIVALDLQEGHVAWSWQAAAGDAWNVGCMVGYDSCPNNHGPDSDIGSGTMLVKLPSGRELILAGLKSGLVLALDADHHDRVLWSNRVGHGSVQGGVQYGMAYDGRRLYVPISDMVYPTDATATTRDPAAGIERPGLYAIDPSNGKFVWKAPALDSCGTRKDCNSGILASIVAIPDVIFAGHMDGQIRAYDSGNGTLLWNFDTAQPLTALGGASAHGGSIGGGGPVVHDGMVYTNSGYGVYAHMPGNVLIAFSVDGH